MLPVTSKGKIDFTFMESFLTELEAGRIAELSAYLEKSGLDNYELSEQELEALDSLEVIKWKEYKMGDLFTKIETKKLHYKSKELPTEITGNYDLPCLTSSFNNQGLNYYAPRQGATILRSAITIPSKAIESLLYFSISTYTAQCRIYNSIYLFVGVILSNGNNFRY